MDARLDDLARVTPVYEELEGWKTATVDVRAGEDLPTRAVEYLEFLERHVGVPISLVGVGPGRDQLVPFGSRQASLMAANL